MAVLNTFTNYRIDRLIRSLTYNTNVSIIFVRFKILSAGRGVLIDATIDDIIARENLSVFILYDCGRQKVWVHVDNSIIINRDFGILCTIV